MLIELLAVVLILGLVAFLAYRLLPEPFKSATMAVCVVILVLWLLRFIPRAGVY